MKEKDATRFLREAMSAKRGFLVAIIQVLIYQIHMYRRRHDKRIMTTEEERDMLMLLAEPLGKKAVQYIFVVGDRAWRGWKRRQLYGDAPSGKMGRPRLPQATVDLIVRIAKAGFYGYKQVLGKLLALGHKASLSSVRNVVKRHHLGPRPWRFVSNWSAYVQRHLDTLLATDFCTKKVLTWRGVRTFYILFFIHLGSRRVYFAGISEHPHSAWVDQHARNLSWWLDTLPCQPDKLIRDGDGKYQGDFDRILAGDGIKVQRIAAGCPDMNAYAESFVATLKRECLDHFTPIGEDHLWRLLRMYNQYYNEERPHTGIDYHIPEGKARDPTPVPLDAIVTKRWLGGLHFSFHPRAA